MIFYLGGVVVLLLDGLKGRIGPNGHWDGESRIPDIFLRLFGCYFAGQFLRLFGKKVIFFRVILEEKYKVGKCSPMRKPLLSSFPFFFTALGFVVVLRLYQEKVEES